MKYYQKLFTKSIRRTICRYYSNDSFADGFLNVLKSDDALRTLFMGKSIKFVLLIGWIKFST